MLACVYSRRLLWSLHVSSSVVFVSAFLVSCRCVLARFLAVSAGVCLPSVFVARVPFACSRRLRLLSVCDGSESTARRISLRPRCGCAGARGRLRLLVSSRGVASRFAWLCFARRAVWHCVARGAVVRRAARSVFTRLFGGEQCRTLLAHMWHVRSYTARLCADCRRLVTARGVRSRDAVCARPPPPARRVAGSDFAWRVGGN